jgi:hypothetical protein
LEEKVMVVGERCGILSQYSLDSKRNRSNATDGLFAINSSTCSSADIHPEFDEVEIGTVLLNVLNERRESQLPLLKVVAD